MTWHAVDEPIDVAIETEPHPVPGDVLGGKYRIESLIAEGGMGLVMRALHLELDCHVAIKLIRPEHVGNDDVVARLLAEARVAASLHSRHTNRVLDVGRTDGGLPYLVLEYLDGSDLGHYLSSARYFAVVDAADHVLQACEALAEAHALGIVHRDIKPENLFLSADTDGELVLKVLDFGISKAPSRHRAGRALTNPFELIGSPNYMSPEQINASEVDARSDIWALGVLLYELCTGEVLFEAPTVTESFARILDPRWLPPPLAADDESQLVQRVIGKCLSRNPDHRYQDVVELAQDLGAAGSDPLQPARVARVARAARARVTASVSDAMLGVTFPTPLALTTSEVEARLEPLRGQRMRWWQWAIVGASGVVSCAIALGFVPGGASQSSASRTEAPVSPASPAVIKQPPPIEPAPTIAACIVPPAANSALLRPWHASKREPRKRAPVLSLASAADPAKDPEAIEKAPLTAAVDAWDPKNFGGRR